MMRHEHTVITWMKLPAEWKGRRPSFRTMIVTPTNATPRPVSRSRTMVLNVSILYRKQFITVCQ